MKTPKLADIRKALIGAAVPALVVVLYSVTPDSADGSRISAVEWACALVAALTTGGSVFGVRNGNVPVRVTPPE
jgi:hypothetical protein